MKNRLQVTKEKKKKSHLKSTEKLLALSFIEVLTRIFFFNNWKDIQSTNPGFVNEISLF